MDRLISEKSVMEVIYGCDCFIDEEVIKERIKAIPSAEPKADREYINKELLDNSLCDGVDCCDCRFFVEGDTEPNDCLLFSRIRALPSVTIPSAEPKWIPVSERLPEKHGNYFVTLIDKDYSDNKIRTMQIAYWTGLKWELDFEECNSIVAWMPLPAEPYKPQESEG